MLDFALKDGGLCGWTWDDDGSWTLIRYAVMESSWCLEYMYSQCGVRYCEVGIRLEATYPILSIPNMFV